MKIAFGGDCCIIGDALLHNCAEYIQIPAYHQADKRIINLEQAISDQPPISGKTTIYATTDCKTKIQSLKADFVSLANNHIHDCGDAGILETLNNLQSWGIPVVGAGKNETAAQTGVTIADNLVLLAYCQYGTHYLRGVCCAQEEKPGVNGFSLKKVLQDLDQLNDDVFAIISIHWAAEYVALPPKEIINWAKKILEHPKCCLIVGHHPHIPLGCVRHNGKEAYLSLGNLLFPNFFLNERQELCQPKQGDRYAEVDMLMKVPCLTHKIWQKINRQSILITFDTEEKRISDITFSQQDRYLTETKAFLGKDGYFARKRFELLSKIYGWPESVYAIACKLCMLFTYGIRKCKRMCFYLIGAKHKEIYK